MFKLLRLDDILIYHLKKKNVLKFMQDIDYRQCNLGFIIDTLFYYILKTLFAEQRKNMFNLRTSFEIRKIQENGYWIGKHVKNLVYYFFLNFYIYVLLKYKYLLNCKNAITSVLLLCDRKIFKNKFCSIFCQFSIFLSLPFLLYTFITLPLDFI